MHFEIRHGLGRAEAKRRIDAGMPALEKHIPGGGAVQAEWTSDSELAMAITAMGQTVRVRLEVEDDLVRGDIDIPMMLSMMSGPINDFVAKSARIMLEKDPPRAG